MELEKLIRDSHAPDRVRASFGKVRAAGREFSGMEEELPRLVRLFEQSSFAADILRQHDEAWRILVEGVYQPCAAMDAEGLRRDLALSLFEVMVKDILELVPFEATLPLISAAADRAAASAWGIASRELLQRFGAPEGYTLEREGFTVLGLGKLGGCELNFSSDIDLVFIYGVDGESSGGSRGRLSNSEWYARAAERVIELLSSKLLGNIAYRVDMRLRPEGRTGQIIRSIDSTVRHYESEGEAWERQAFIRARPMCGDKELGAEFVRRIQPFIYKRYLDRDAVLHIESIKRKIEQKARGDGDRNVKLSAGGIREIEFIVQILQLADGGRCLAVRTASTMEALARLAEHKYLMETDRDFLLDAYLFLRRIEHRLQMLDGRQTHMLPEDARELDALAKGLRFPCGAELMAKYGEVTRGVRDYYEKRFAGTKRASITQIESDLIAILDDAETAELAPASGAYSKEARAEFRMMARQSSADSQSSAVRTAFLRAAPTWVPKLYALPEPDQGLKRLSRIIERYGAKTMLYEIFASHPSVAEILVDISSLSEFLSSLIYKDPSALEALLSPDGVTGARDLAALSERLASFRKVISNPLRAAAAIRTEEELRVGVRFLMGMADAERTGRELSDVAELLLGETRFCVVALGRFGGRDIGFASDLDLVFVADQGEDAAKEAQEAIAGWTKCGLRIDMRLRPHGKTAPAVGDVGAFEKYLATEAASWERIAWARSRIVAGPEKLRRRVAAAVEDFLFAKPFGANDIREIAEMRRRLMTESNASNELKRGRGGSISIDFVCASQRILHRATSTDPKELLGEMPNMLAAHRYVRLLEMSAQIATGHSFRMGMDTADMRRMELIMARHGGDISRLDEMRSIIDIEWSKYIAQFTA